MNFIARQPVCLVCLYRNYWEGLLYCYSFFVAGTASWTQNRGGPTSAQWGLTTHQCQVPVGRLQVIRSGTGLVWAATHRFSPGCRTFLRPVLRTGCSNPPAWTVFTSVMCWCISASTQVRSSVSRSLHTGVQGYYNHRFITLQGVP